MAPSIPRNSRNRPLATKGLALRWGVLRHRRRLAVLCGLCAAAATVLALRPVEAESVPVLTAAHDLTTTDEITGSAVTVRVFPAALVPDDALASDTDLSQHRLNTPVSQGEVLTSARLAEPAAAEYGTGLVAAPVRINDPGVAELVSPGTRIDVLATADADFGLGSTAGAATVVASDCPVMAVPEPEAGNDALLLIAVPEDEAQQLASSATHGHLSITIRSQ